MKQTLFWIMLTLLSVGSVIAAPRGQVIGVDDAEHPPWFKQSFLEIAEDVVEANAQDKHVMLYFHLDGCPYCAKMVRENFKGSAYSQFLQDNFDVIAINIRGDREVLMTDDISLTEKQLAEQLKVRYTPTIIFLDRDNSPVLRLNGYRSVDSFKHVLDFIDSEAYRHTTLAGFVEQQQQPVYTLRDDPAFTDLTDLSQVTDKPLMVLFEDSSCDECATFHDTMFDRDDTRKLLDGLTVVRLDAYSEQPIIDVHGHQTTPKAFAEELGISYRPGIVLFNNDREIIRIDGMLRRFHFQTVLRYVSEGHYRQYPEFRDYNRAYQDTLLESGQDIDIWE